VKNAGKPIEENRTIKFTLCGTGILPVQKKVKSNLFKYKIP
jgi:hypothetical protein